MQPVFVMAWPLLRNRDYMLLVSTLVSAASWVVYPLLILALTGSPATAAALGHLPYLLSSLPAGALIDRLGPLFSVPVAALWLDVLTIWQL